MTTNPYTLMFDMQRSMYNQQKQLVSRTFDLQRKWLESMDAGLDAQKSVEERARSMADMTMEATMDAIESSSPSQEPVTEDLREMVDEQMAAGQKLSDETWSVIESQLDESVSAYGEWLDQTEDLYMDLFEAYLGAFEQVEETVDEAA